MRRALILGVVLIAALLLVNVGWPAFWAAGWTPVTFSGRCWASVCVISDEGYVEVSFNEYQHPADTVPSVAPPVLPAPGP